MDLIYRPRRLRRTETLRNLVRETHLTRHDLIYPMFVRYGKGIKNPIPSMPNHYQFSIDLLVEEAKSVWDSGVEAIILFGIPETKDAEGSDAMNTNGIIGQAIRAVKKALPDLVVIADVCFCEYTSHGHCGVLEEGDVDNDKTLENLGKQVVAQAEAGVDMVAPSGMMDGMVMAIRDALDFAGFTHIPIMSYAAKYASSFYGPFRDAAESAPQFGNRKTYQMDPGNAREALREVELDVEEGADIIMVKPAMPYLDILCKVREEFDLPIAAYQVSGEFSMIEAAAEKGWINRKEVILESLISIKRGGADLILTYFAKEVASWI
ncbi:MAG: porphobilinogen synthase [Planctomycetota bacterium]|nr:MAG: porphobilinogen synthase [Planctomycetota bacterium]